VGFAADFVIWCDACQTQTGCVWVHLEAGLACILYTQQPCRVPKLPTARFQGCMPAALSPCPRVSVMHATLQKGLHWSKVLTARLNKDVKLVGCTISCESAYMGGIASSEARHNAHVQSYVIATDQVQSFPSHAPLLHLLNHANIHKNTSACWKCLLTVIAAIK